MPAASFQARDLHEFLLLWVGAANTVVLKVGFGLTLTFQANEPIY